MTADTPTLESVLALAERATPSPWGVIQGREGFIVQAGGENDGDVVESVAMGLERVDAEYIASLSPDVLAPLLRELHSLRQQREADTARLDWLESKYTVVDTAEMLAEVEMEGKTPEGNMYVTWDLPGTLRDGIDRYMARMHGEPPYDARKARLASTRPHESTPNE